MAIAVGKGSRRLRDFAFTAALCSHVLAWVAVVLLELAPLYQGVSVTATSATATSGEISPNPPVQATATLIEVNGWSVLPFILAPVAISGAGLLGVILVGRGRVLRRAPLGISALLLLGFVIAGSLSIGMFYLPAALAMAVSWAVSLGQRRERAVSS